MNTELSSKYDPSAVEAAARQVWMDEHCFSADPSRPGPSFTIVIPPPNVTGALHLGHAINNTLQDILIRMHRMAGFNTLWIPGIDHAGIATQAVVEKQLKEQENKTRHDVGREGLVERIWKWKEQYGNRILEQLQRLGCSCDWDRTRFTLDDMCAKAVRETFFKLFKDGLIYRGKRLVNWDTFLQTSISDDEIYYEAVKTHLWHIKYPIEDALTPSPLYAGERAGVRGGTSNDVESQGASTSGPSPLPSPPSTGEREQEPSRPAYMVVATTRPETMLGDTAVAVHSEDPRWNWAIGKFVRLPLVDRLIPIIADDILVDPKFGTGVVKVTPAHDPNDYAVWQRHQGKADQIDLLNILTPDGKINADRPEWSQYSGLKRTAARTKVVDDLKAAGLLVKEEPYETQVGHSDRSKTPVEPYLSDQWFVKMAPLAEPALDVVRQGKIKFHPERHAQQYLSWLGEKRDWPVSRQLWWGHRIPVWTKSTRIATEEDSEKLGRALGQLFVRRTIIERVDEVDLGYEIQIQNRETGEVVPYAKALVIGPGTYDIHVCFRDDASDAGMEESGLQQDPDVLDTWFSSALWPHSTLGWPEQTPELAKYYPTSVLLTGRDIITLWVARMVMMGMYNMGKKEGEKGREGEGETKASGQTSRAEESPIIAEGGSPGSSPVSPGLPPSAIKEEQACAAGRAEARALGLPFLDVAINPTILDGKGERMSKSKGNGVDPVDIIDSYGADALRFTMTKMATETQDARLPVKRDASGKNTSDKFDEGRNFCNKLWNACRFTLSNLETVHAEPVDESKWTLADHWILGRFSRVVNECDSAIKEYRFDVYAKSCYDFFWGDFCDWYVEAVKPALRDPARAGQTANVLTAVLDGALRLMHPMIPFITETIWWRLNDVRPARGLGAKLACPPSKRLVLAAWPTNLPAPEPEVEASFTLLQSLIGALRTIRNDYKVNPKQTIAGSIKAPAHLIEQIKANRELIELLAGTDLKAIAADLKAPANSVSTATAGCEVFAEGLIDEAAEKTRLTKEIESKKKSVESLKGRLSNEAYISKAPAKLVQQTKDQLAAAEADVVKLEEALRKLA